MIVTFTANPSIDRTAELDGLVRGEVLRTTGVRVDGGGKGVNVARALHANGVESIAVLPLGGAEGHQMLALLKADRLRLRTVAIAGSLRTNITIAEPDGTTTKLNEAGPTLSPSEIAALCDTLVDAATGADWVVLAGSLPPGAPSDLYATLVERLHAAGRRVAVDCDGALLASTVVAGPDLVKPNAEELAGATGMPVVTAADAVAAVERLRSFGARAVLASLGGDGALLVDATGAHLATTRRIAARSTVGAGDATLAGFLAAGGSGPDALAEGVAWGSAAVALPGSQMPSPSQLDRTHVHVTAVAPQEVPS